MLPKKHFDRIEKEARDMMAKAAADAAAAGNKNDASKSKKVVDTKENAIEKSAGASSDNDEYEYDYYYDDNDNYTSDGDDIVTVTPKNLPTINRTFKSTHLAHI